MYEAWHDYFKTKAGSRNGFMLLKSHTHINMHTGTRKQTQTQDGTRWLGIGVNSTVTMFSRPRPGVSQRSRLLRPTSLHRNASRGTLSVEFFRRYLYPLLTEEGLNWRNGADMQ